MSIEMSKQIEYLRTENAQLIARNAELLGFLDKALNEIALLKEENQNLKDEIAILKKQKPRPKIPPSILEGPHSRADEGNKTKSRGKHPRKKKKNNLVIHNNVRLKPENLPEGAIYKGVHKFTVQDIKIENVNTVYERERWLLPDGTYAVGQLPVGVNGHYGAELKAYILHQHYACRVTEPLLLNALREMGVLISAGQLSRLLVESKELFHEEKEELLAAGIAAKGGIQVDDIGARHNGANAYTTVIGNELFASFSTNASKSRINFLQLLHGGRAKYVLNDDAFSYLMEQNPESTLASSFIESDLNRVMDETEFKTLLNERSIISASAVRLVTEASLYASLIELGIPRDLRIHADDAKQFAVFILSLCWVHEERHYRKLRALTDETQQLIDQVRGQIWQLYRGLKAYKVNPSESERARLEQEFDRVFLQKTSSHLLNDRLALSYAKKDRLLTALSHPSVPLHNNATETDGRAGVVLKKVSGGTRNEAGKRARDTFLSLKQTTRKLCVSFRRYLKDRLSGENKIPRLSELIRTQRSCQPAGP